MKINTKINIKTAKKGIPSLITISRLFLAFIFAYLLLNNQVILSALIFMIAIGTDVLDGYLARKFNLESSIGGYLDTVVDFILVLISFVVFVVLGTYSVGILLIIIFMFFQFIITSSSQKPVYDPLGKYYGGFLFLIVLLTLIFQNKWIYFIFTILIIIFTIMSLLSRIFFMKRKLKKDN